jgi:hypothetical protein
LLPVTSKDGVDLEFSITVDLANLARAHRSVSLGLRDGNRESYIPLKVLEDVGRGDTKLGLDILAFQVSHLDFDGFTLGSLNPLYSGFIHPYYGGEDGFAAAMEAEK